MSRETCLWRMIHMANMRSLFFICLFFKKKIKFLLIYLLLAFFVVTSVYGPKWWRYFEDGSGPKRRLSGS